MPGKVHGGDSPNAASIAIVRGNAVLLVRRAHAPYAGSWTLPGGRLEPEETAERAARREVTEELGLILGDLQHLVTMSAGPRWQLQVFAAQFAGGDVIPSEEIASWGWFSLAEAEGLTTTPGLTEVLRLALRAEATGE